MPPQGDGQRKALGLEYQGRKLNLESLVAPFYMGRAPECQLAVESEYASRMHAFIESKRDHFIFTDQSTNGSYLGNADGELVFLKRESVRLLGSGVISLGIRPQADDDNLIYYSYRDD